MRKTFVLLVSVTALTLFVAGSMVLAGNGMKQDKEHGGRPLSVQLTGAEEVPGPGDADGSGSATITLNHGQGQVCYDIAVSNIQAPTAAHIHVGAAGQAGDVRVGLTVAEDGTWKGCVAADKDLIKDIMQNPANYYLNVHNQEFPNGAVRGQLAK